MWIPSMIIGAAYAMICGVLLLIFRDDSIRQTLEYMLYAFVLGFLTPPMTRKYPYRNYYINGRHEEMVDIIATWAWMMMPVLDELRRSDRENYRIYMRMGLTNLIKDGAEIPNFSNLLHMVDIIIRTKTPPLAAMKRVRRSRFGRVRSRVAAFQMASDSFNNFTYTPEVLIWFGQVARAIGIRRKAVRREVERLHIRHGARRDRKTPHVDLRYAWMLIEQMPDKPDLNPATYLEDERIELNRMTLARYDQRNHGRKTDPLLFPTDELLAAKGV